MKTLPFIFLLAGFLLTGCNQKKELDKAEAFQLIKKELSYPRVLEHEIFCADPHQARNILKLGLEEQGLITVDRTQKLKDAGRPLIHFTDKAKPYLIYGSPEQQTMDFTLEIQKVKIADEDIQEVTSVIPSDDGKTIVVAYNTAYKNISPFRVLVKRNLEALKKNNLATFRVSDQGEWILQKNL